MTSNTLGLARLLCLMVAVAFLGGMPLACHTEGSGGGDAEHGVEATLTVDGTPTRLTVLDAQDEGDYVYVTVSDKPVSRDVELASYDEEGITGVQFAFVKEPIALDEYLPVMLAHSAFGHYLPKGAEFAGESTGTGVFDVTLSIPVREMSDHQVALELQARVDLGD